MIANCKNKPFLKMTSAQRDKAVKALDREILFEETKALSSKGKALWDRARRAPARKAARNAKSVSITLDPSLLKESDEYARHHGITRSQPVAKGLRAVLPQ